MDKFLRKISTLLVYLFFNLQLHSCAWASDMDDNGIF
ncbi:hypothetical protein BvCmsNSP032_02430 [Escherichia coli]|nr:hypothetical protein BvCmsNSP032_02430 [Escherichia coli]GDR37630.1 hypothetical protein BvCmsNSP011_03424 [Escherichia coli]GDW61556.1 hypothetical protein BvCmsSIP075_00403 [Escherichia coli]GDW85568.1 hypothetical protein BvCmsSIP076_00028 [Escherichia coli]